MDARRALLARLIDHAPLFPPASLPLADALADHERARTSDASWMVNRFVCPASRLSELGHSALRISLVLDTGVVADAAFDDERVEALELPPAQDPGALANRRGEVYVELPFDGDLTRRLRELAGAEVHAKVRCGGARVPTVPELAGFIRACREHTVVFKATAGLHHAVRTDGEHGFLNLLAACAFGSEDEVLADRDASNFAVTAEHFAWRDHVASADDVARVRRGLFVSVGSCSFSEPVDELRTLGVLPL